MKNILLLAILILFGDQVFSQSAGFNQTYIIINNTYYDLNATTPNTDFNGANLGSFCAGATTGLTFNGAEHNNWKCGGCDITSTRLFYNIHLTSSAVGSFVSNNIPFTSDFSNGCGGKDQRWSKNNYSTNLLTGLAPGNYTMEVYSEESTTCFGTVYASNSGANYKASFTVLSLPTITTATSTSICSDASTNLGLTASVPSNFSWTLGTNLGSISGAIAGNGSTINQTLNNPSNTTAGSVVYSVTPISTTGFCAGSATNITVTVNPKLIPSISIAANVNDTVCSGTAVTFTATVTNGGTQPVFHWEKNGSPFGSDTGIEVYNILSSVDSVRCYVISSLACITNPVALSNSIKFTVKPSPNIGTSTGGVICSIGGTKTLYNSNTQGGGIWTTDNPAIATVTTANGAAGAVVATGAGTANLTYTKTGTNGCKSMVTVPVVVAPVAIPSAIIGAASICKGASSQLSSVTTGGIWQSASSSIATIDSVTGLVTGRYQGTAPIKYIVKNANGCSNYASTNLTVYAIPALPNIQYAVGAINPQAYAVPTTAFCNNKTFGLVGSPAGGVWSSTNTNVATVTSGGMVSIVGTGNGSIVYTITVNGCSNSRTTLGTVVNCPGHRETNNNELVTSSNDFIIYPNPAKSLVNLSLDKLVGTGKLLVVDYLGKVVKEQTLSMGSNSINIANLSRGFYFVSIVTSEGKTTKKLIVE